MALEAENSAHSDNQIDLSAIRTTLALDRTLFAWIRTSLTLTAFGFTLAKFVHDLIAKGMLHGVQPMYPRLVGFALMALGLATLLGGAFEYVRISRKIHANRIIWSLSLIITLCLGVLSIILMSSLVAELSSY